MPHTWRTEPNTTATVAKADDAKVNTHMWDARITAIWHTFTPRRLTLLRRVALGFICKSLYNEFCKFMRNKYNTLWSSYIEGHSGSRDFRGEEGEFGKDLVAGKAVLYSYFGSSYQGWDRGSSLIFWRWARPILARDGIPPYLYDFPNSPSSPLKSRDSE